MITLIPVLIIFILVVIKSTSKLVFFKTGRASKQILFSYIVFLTFSVLFAYIMPIPNVAKKLNVDIELVEETAENFYNIANEGQLSNAEGIYESNKWSFAYDKEQLTVQENSGQLILFEKKAESDGQIDVVHYTTKYIFDGFDYTDKIEPPTVKLAVDQLTITEPPRVDIKLATFQKEFTITQFTGEGNGMFDNQHRIWGIDALVIHVPANVEVSTNQNDSVEFINE